MLSDAPGALRPATGATASQSSAVMNGATGCNKRSTVSSVRIRVRRVARCWAAVALGQSGPWRFPGTNRSTRPRQSCRSPLATLSKPIVGKALGDRRFHTLQLTGDPAVGHGKVTCSRGKGPPGARTRPWCVPSSRSHGLRSSSSTNLVAFQSLLQKLRYPSQRLAVEVDVAAQRGVAGHGEAQRVGARRQGYRPGILFRSACARAVRSRACAGRWCVCPARAPSSMPSIRSTGSSTLPSLLLIFWPCASRTRPWM